MKRKMIIPLLFVMILGFASPALVQANVTDNIEMFADGDDKKAECKDEKKSSDCTKSADAKKAECTEKKAECAEKSADAKKECAKTKKSCGDK